ncbi:MAG: ABC transporter ATP-binding protein [Lachnospiraceae bacterium]
MSADYITLKEVNKKFVTKRSEIYALQDINMEFAKGEFVSIVGPSGCGKSTIIRLIDDIIKPTSGEIVVDGIKYDNTKEISKEMIKKLGFIFQVPNLYPWLTVRENVMLPLKIHKLTGAAYERKADELLAYVGLTEYADAYPSAISGGMSQRIGVIRGMIHNPEILMMDEPFGALDENTRESLNLELLKIWKDTGMTIIFITHNVEEAVLLSQRIYVMSSHPRRITTELAIDFGEKERTLDLLYDPKFAKYCVEIEELIGHLQLDEIK